MTMTRSRRLRAAVPVAFGALIASIGLVLGGIGTASAHGGHGQPPPDSSAPRHGGSIPNVTLVENQIKAYYGSVTKDGPGCGTVVVAGCIPNGEETLPSPESNYAREMYGIEARAVSYLRAHSHGHSVSGWRHGRDGRPAVVFDIDDTLVNTYNYEIAQQFGYTPASNAIWVQAEAFPAVFGMPALVSWAADHGYTIFFITGRPVGQLDATAGNLIRDGYPRGVVDTDRMFLKDTEDPPDYLACAADCTTIEYKSGTRAYIESLGYDIVANFGDQYSDLKGGHADRTFKLPNPMYYLP